MEEMTLAFACGVDDVRIWVDARIEGSYRAGFDGVQPDVREIGGTVEIVYPRHPFAWARSSADIALSPSVAWRIVIRGGASRLAADLRGLRLLGMDVGGGASRVEMRLDEPIGPVPLHVGGGASRVTVVRPLGAAASVAIGGGASRLTLDAQHFDAIGGRTRLETGDYQAAGDHLDLTVGGGASRVALIAA